jgi:spore germination cell wall hydrolase CwlJ-like protein
VETSEVVEVGIEEADQMEADIDLLARLITAEVGYSTAYDPLDYELACYLTGSVVLNRMKHEQYPDTLEGVIYDPGQYSPTWNGSINRPYDDTAWEIAEELLTYGTDIDESVIFQANFEQGSGVYQEIGNLKFCYE